MPQRTSTTRLPAALREQIDQEFAGQNTERQPKRIVNRKEARKQDRRGQKQRRAVFFSRPKTTESHVSQKRPVELVPEPDEGRPQKKARISDPSSASSPGRPKKGGFSTVQHHGSRVVSIVTVKTPPPDSKSTTKKRHRLDDPEDAQIAWLESKLGTVRSKTRKKSTYFGDGLDDLLEDLDRIVPSAEESLEPVSGSESSEGSETSEFEGFGHMPAIDTPEHCESGGEVTEDMAPRFATTSEANHAVSDAVKASPGTRYVPPQLRQRTNDEAETLARLSRQMKGLLNRLSEQNMSSILSSIEQIYRAHRRNDITSTLTDLIIDGIASHSSLLDSFVVLHATLIASLYKIIGVELAAHFVQCLVASYETNYSALRTSDMLASAEHEDKGKECLNLVVLLSELYNFQVVSCVLVYDIIRSLLDRLDEFDVELLLKIARNAGQQLRQDDPYALKDIIQIVQNKMNKKEQSSISSRTRFMIETLINLKNNKTKQNAEQYGRSESVDRMKKFLSALGRKHHVLAHEPLRITLDDLHSSEKRGKWWLVGSSWAGDPLLERSQNKSTDTSKEMEDALVKLSRKQGMNTDIRRSIFVVLMSGDDYVDACERLSQLNLTEIQQREIIRVILHCLGNERLYNPYYSLVVQQLCKLSHSHKVTLQFCLWDFLRGLGESGVGGADIVKNVPEDDTSFRVTKISPTRLLNVARAYAWWIAKGSSSLTILKPVDFMVLQPQSLEFFRALFSQLFISTQVTSPVVMPNEEAAEHLGHSRSREALEEVFMKATRFPTLTQGLLYFLTASLRGDGLAKDKVVSETLRWAREVAKDTLRTGKDVVASLS